MDCVTYAVMGFFIGFFIRSFYVLYCKKENFISFTILSTLIDKGFLYLRDKNGKELKKYEIYQMLDIHNSFAEKIWFDDMGEE